MRRRLIVASCLLLVVGLVGCSDKYRKAAVAVDEFAASLQAFQSTEIALHEQGLIDNEEHVAIQRVLRDVALSGKELNNAIRVAHSRPTAVVALQASLYSTQHLLDEGVLKVKNPQARAQLTTIILAARGFLATIAAVIN